MTDKHPDSVVSLDAVGVTYRRRVGFMKRNLFPALSGVSLEMFRGESLGVVGNNGSGKTTLSQVVTGIVVPDSGVITHRARSSVLLRLQLGFDPSLSGRQNAVLSAMLQGLDKRTAIARLDSMIDFAGLDSAIDDPLHTYSTGMRARLGFAVAFELDADLIVIDEVLGVGDAEFRARSQQAIRERVASDRTVLLISHNLRVLEDACDRVLWLEKGRVRAIGDPAEVIAAYRGAIPDQRKNG